MNKKKCVCAQPNDEDEEQDRERECSSSCAHYDEVNQCCWQAGDWGLYIEVSEGDCCHLGYRENDGR